MDFCKVNMHQMTRLEASKKRNIKIQTEVMTKVAALWDKASKEI